MERKHTSAPKAPWYIRLAVALGMKPGSKEWKNTRNDFSKHARAKTPKAFYAERARRKTRRQMADRSRRINRGR